MLPKFYHDFSAENEFQAQKPTFMIRVLSLKTNMEKTFHDIGSSSSVRHVQHVTMWHMPSSFALNLHDKTKQQPQREIALQCVPCSLLEMF